MNYFQIIATRCFVKTLKNKQIPVDNFLIKPVSINIKDLLSFPVTRLNIMYLRI